MINFKQLKSVLDQGKAAPSKDKKMLSPLEKLYHEVEQAILLQNQNIYQEMKPLPTCLENEMRNLNNRHYGLLSFYQETQEKLTRLEAEFNVQELRRLLAYLEQYYHYIKAVITCSQELFGLRQQLEEQINAIVGLGRKLQQTHSKADLQQFEKDMEEILDKADWFKDKLEDLRGRNIEPTSLMPLYQIYSQKLALLQEDLLEASAWIS
ncbi:MAG: hypothetical protein AB7I41_07405 [Candidatus Sericytochromatia bacterium]